MFQVLHNCILIQMRFIMKLYKMRIMKLSHFTYVSILRIVIWRSQFCLVPFRDKVWDIKGCPHHPWKGQHCTWTWKPQNGCGVRLWDHIGTFAIDILPKRLWQIWKLAPKPEWHQEPHKWQWGHLQINWGTTKPAWPTKIETKVKKKWNHFFSSWNRTTHHMLFYLWHLVYIVN